MTALPRAILCRILLVFLGVCASLVVIEAALRMGALFVGTELMEQPVWMGRWRMLCLGDSNTYGIRSVARNGACGMKGRLFVLAVFLERFSL